MNDIGIEILLSSDSDYEELTVEIYCDGKFVALLNQDEGVDNLIIEFPGKGVEEGMILRKIDLAIFERGLDMAKRKLEK